MNIRCFLGRFRPDLNLAFALDIDNKSIPEHFELGSVNANGHVGIRMALDTSRLNSAVAPTSQRTTAFALHQSLRRLTRNPAQANIINNIGLIFADRFEHRAGLLGLMFDFGFNPTGMDAVGSEFTDVPREGCCIFMDAISSLRGNGEAYRREIVFTAIHELGHVFNLWHLENPSTFMSTSKEQAPFPSSACFFHHTQRAFLNRADFDENVQPGGSPFDSRGPFGPAANEPFSKKSKVITVLRLRISVSQKEFWYFEPIEMDVRLSSIQPITVPDKIDPGYENFIIHVTRPNGTVFKYRSPRVYCQNLTQLEIAPGKPFIRDISIFGQSGGYTFTLPGEYKIQCVFNCGKDGSVISNTLSVYVKQPAIARQKFQLLQDALTRKEPALLLYHRNGIFRPQSIRLIEEIAAKEKKSDLGVNLMYALARFKTGKVKKLNSAEKQEINRMSNIALDSGKLGKAREKNLTSLSKQLNL